MGKATRIRQQNAREKIAAQRAAEKRAEQRRRLFITGGAVLGVIVIVVAFIIVKSMSSPTTTPTSTARTPLPASVANQVTNVPASALATVGKGSVLQFNPVPITKVTGPALTSNGKPEMLYIGAEYCPYCAATRWSMAVALSRFGTLSKPLHGIHSSSSDVYPDTATLTFYKTGYNSKYLVFTPVENENINRSLLQSPTAQQNQVWARYEPDPTQRGYPFISFGNKYILKGPIYNPAVLKGLTWSQIAADLHNPSSPVAQGVLGGANYITAAICKMTNSQPASVCAAPSITAVAGGL
jgi:thiol-disulfide isomerase/thioredoxin